MQASVVVACRLSSCGSWALEYRLSSCGTQALLLCGMWDLPGPGLKPVSPALAGGFLTTAPPGKSLTFKLDRVTSRNLTTGVTQPLSSCFLQCKRQTTVVFPCGIVLKIKWDGSGEVPGTY